MNTLLGREELLLLLPVLDAVLDDHPAPGDGLEEPPPLVGSLDLQPARSIKRVEMSVEGQYLSPRLTPRELRLHLLGCALGPHSPSVQHDDVLRRDMCSGFTVYSTVQYRTIQYNTIQFRVQEGSHTCA